MWGIYYLVVFGICAVCAFVFRAAVFIDGFSVVPGVFLLLMLFQAYLFHHADSGYEFQTAHGSDLNGNEERSLYVCAMMSLLFCAPLQVFFVLFFPSGFKLFSLLLYFVGLVSGTAVFRVRRFMGQLKRIKAKADEKKKGGE